MQPDWRSAIEQAFALEAAILVHTRTFINALYERRAIELADHLNSELRSLAFAAAACETLHEIILARAEMKLPTGHERRLSYPMYTDAIIAAFNAKKFIGSSEMKDKIGKANVEAMLKSFDQHLPRTIEASHAIRHHHDRALGRVRANLVKEKNEQFVAVWGASIKVTDEVLNEFWYKFSPSSVRSLMVSLADIVGK
jgi:hypothetical protein